MKKLITGALSAAILLTTASGAAADTKLLKGSFENLEGDDTGSITVTVKTNDKGVATHIRSAALVGVPTTCEGDDGDESEGDPVSAVLKVGKGIKPFTPLTAKGKSFTFNKKAKDRAGKFTWRISGKVNKKGTKIRNGVLKSPDVSADADTDCSVKTTFTAEEVEQEN